MASKKCESKISGLQQHITKMPEFSKCLSSGFIKIFLSVVFLSLMVIKSTGCKEKGPAEKAGQELDESLDKAGDKVNDLLGK